MQNIFWTIITLIILASLACRQGHVMMGEKAAREILHTALSTTNKDISVHAVTDSASFVKAIEPTLFAIYGKSHIEGQRPYELYHFEKYWIAMGTMDGDKGGTFEVVLDGERNKIVYVMHGK